MFAQEINDIIIGKIQIKKVTEFSQEDYSYLEKFLLSSQ